MLFVLSSISHFPSSHHALPCSKLVANIGCLRLTPELIAECERVVSKTFPACVAFHKPSFVQQLKNASLESTLVYGLLTCAARYVTLPLHSTALSDSPALRMGPLCGSIAVRTARPARHVSSRPPLAAMAQSLVTAMWWSIAAAPC